MNRRQRAIGKRLVTLYMQPHTAEAMAEVELLRAELDAMRPAPVVPPPAATPPSLGQGEFVMRKAERPAPVETEADRWRKVIAMRNGTGGSARIWKPERAR